MSVSENTQLQADPSHAESDAIDLRAYWRVILRRRWFIIPFFVAVVLVTIFITLRQTKIYDSTCTIIIDLNAPKVLDNQQVQEVMDSGPGGYWYSKEYYETQYKVITSRAVAERVANELQLTRDTDFVGGGGTTKASLESALGILSRNLKVEPVKDSRIVRLRYEDPKPERAARIANAFADAYIAENLGVRNSTNRNASDWLGEQLRDLEGKLEKTGKALFDFKKENDIVSTTWEDRQSMVSQRLTAINDALTKARIEKAQLQARNAAIQGLGTAVEQGDATTESLQPVISSVTIQQLKLRYFEIKAECEDLNARYLEQHPKAEACAKKLATAKASLQQEIKTVLSAEQRQYQETAKTERNLLTLYNDTKADAFNLNQHEGEYTELKRAYDNNQRLYDLVLKRLKDMGVTGMLQVSNVRVLDRAQLKAQPVRPNVRQNILLAIFLGLAGGVALAFMVEYLDTSIISQEQVNEKLGLTFLGIIPRIEKAQDGSAQDLLVYSQPKSAVAECLRSVRTNLLFMSPEKPLKTILITSSGPQEGKTTTAAALAETMAGSTNRVLLMDADMRRPRLHRIFSVPNGSGLSSLILGEGTLEGEIKSTEVPNLFVLPCGPLPPNPSELLHTAAFGSILEQACQRFDRVIIDSPPVGVVSDAVVMATRVDGTLLVLKAGKTSRDVARQAVRQLKDVNARIFGAVLNDLDLENQKYGQYHYYYRYGYYYGGDKGETQPAKVA